MNPNTEYLGCSIEDASSVVFFHHPCQDGFTAAWVTHLYLDPTKTCYWGTTYTDEFWDDTVETDYSVFADKEVFIVDFSFPIQELLALAAHAKSVVVCDHHVKFLRLLKEYAESSGEKIPEPHDAPTDEERNPRHTTSILLCANCTVYFHNYICGAEVTEYTFSECLHFKLRDCGLLPIEIKGLLLYIGDRDLWYWEMPEGHAVHRVLALEERTFDAWSLFAERLADSRGYHNIVEAGSILGKSEAVCINKNVRRAVLMDFPGQDRQIPVANVTELISETGQALLEVYPDAPFSATYFYPKPGKRVWSLRARKGDDVDVCKVAAEFGGGGHRKAAGFHTNIGFLVG